MQQTVDRVGPLPSDDVVRIGLHLAHGLAAAHAVGLVHRDVKPGNVLLEAGPQLRAKITDFGLARTIDDANLTQSGAIIGTPMYMSPEQAHGEPLDQRSDLFSLGSVLYLLCTGRPPFRAKSTLSVLKRVVDDEPRPIRELVPETPDWLAAVVERLHCKAPAERFASASEVAEALRLGAEGASHLHSTARRSAKAGRLGRIWRAVGWSAVIAALILAGLFVAEPRRRRESAESAGKVVAPPNGEPSSDATPSSVTNATTPAVTPRNGQPPSDSAVFAMEVADWNDPATLRKVASLPLLQQEATVRLGLSQLNQSDEGVRFEVADGAIVGLYAPVRAAADLRPVSALRRLEKLTVVGDPDAPGQVLLEPLLGMRLRELIVPFCRIFTLQPLEGMPLEKVDLRGTAAYLEPLQTIPLREIHLDMRGDRELAFLRKLRSLQRINGMKTDDFWAQHAPAEQTKGPSVELTEAMGGESKPAGVPAPPRTLPPAPPRIPTGAEAEIAAVKAAWIERNWFPPELDFKLEQGRVVEVRISCQEVSDLTPLASLSSLKRLSLMQRKLQRGSDEIQAVSLEPLKELPLEQLTVSQFKVAKLESLAETPLQELAALNVGLTHLQSVTGLKGLRKLDLTGSPITDLEPLRALTKLQNLRLGSSKVSDLRPLSSLPLTVLSLSHSPVAEIYALLGLPLVELDLSSTRVTDLSPLKESNLQMLSVFGTGVSDLSPLAGLPLQHLYLGGTSVADLTPLRGLKLQQLDLTGLKVVDLTPLEGMPLQRIVLVGTKVTDLGPLRGMPLRDVTLVTFGAAAPRDATTPRLLGEEPRLLPTPESVHFDLQPLTGLGIVQLTAVIETQQDLDVLRSLKDLRSVNYENVNQFWKRVELLKPGEAAAPAMPAPVPRQ